jgi:hypothetical protein
MILAVAVVFAGAGTLDLFDAGGKRAGIIREGPGGRVDVYDAESRRIGGAGGTPTDQRTCSTCRGTVLVKCGTGR